MEIPELKSWFYNFVRWNLTPVLRVINVSHALTLIDLGYMQRSLDWRSQVIKPRITWFDSFDTTGIISTICPLLRLLKMKNWGHKILLQIRRHNKAILWQFNYKFPLWPSIHFNLPHAGPWFSQGLKAVSRTIWIGRQNYYKWLCQPHRTEFNDQERVKYKDTMDTHRVRVQRTTQPGSVLYLYLFPWLPFFTAFVPIFDPF